MRIRKPTNITQRPVGLVIDDVSILGEWEGTRWSDVPPKARLYVNKPSDIRGRYETGELTARRWRRGLQRSYGRITGWDWRHDAGHPHVLYNLRGDFDDRNVEQRFRAILAFAEYARANHANIGSPTATVQSILGTTLDRDISLSDRGLPTEQIWRGARIQRRNDLQHEFHGCVLWDIANAFPSKLIQAHIPRRFRHYHAAAHEPIPDTPTGFALAVVFVPGDIAYGPLPAVRYPILGAMRFPVDDVITGVWSFDELRAAQRAGCDVMLEEYWTAHYFAQPFRPFGDLLLDMRRTMLPDAFRIAKRGAVGVVGALAREGQQVRSRWIDNHEDVWDEGGYSRSHVLGIHGLVVSQVRAQVYDEGIRRFPEQFVSCHTDGVILMDDGVAFPGGTGLGLVPGDWSAKREMRTVMLLDAQRYAYTDAAGMHYSVAGVPEERAEAWMDRKAKGHAFRSRYAMV